MHKRQRGAAALLGAVVLVAAACGSSSKTSSTTTAASTSSSSAAASSTSAAATSSSAAAGTTSSAAATTASSAAAAADPFGTPNKATGTPIKFGYFGEGQSAQLDIRDEIETAQAVAKYANDYLGGINGHPIELETCEGKNDVAIATDCANKFVTDNLPAVLFNVSGSSAAFAKVIQGAKIPLFVWSAGDIATDPNSTFIFSNALSSFMQPAAYARDNKITKAGLMVIDVPGASGPAKALGVPMMQKAGVAAPDLVAIPTGAADMLPQAQAELKKNPELIHLIGNDVWCTAALRALRDAGYSGKITMISQCMSDATVKALGSFLKGVLVGYGGTADPNDPDFKLMTAIVNRYVSNPSHVKLASNPIGAYGVMNSFLRIFKDYKGDYTPAALTAYAKASPALPLPLGAGAMFHCDGKAVSILPAICTSGMVQATLDATGQPTDFKAVDPGTLLVFG